jgi:glycosyltransferase involved in cell wall biosynthesis
VNRGAPDITVIVPTRNRLESLTRCLERLAAQRIEEPIEIVVVDDGSDDADGVAEAVSRTPRARLLRQARQGPAAARNAGVEVAQGSVVCFTDDDCEPQANWAALLAETVRAGADVAAGMTTNGEGGNWFAAASQVQADHFAHHSAVPFAASNNIASTTRLLREVEFDARYRGASEDRDWCERLALHGYRIEYEPAATVYHHKRLTLPGYLHQQARYGRGSWRYHRRKSRRSFERPHFYTALIGRGFREGLGIGLLVILGQAALAFGYLQESLGSTIKSDGRSLP